MKKLSEFGSGDVTRHGRAGLLGLVIGVSVCGGGLAEELFVWTKDGYRKATESDVGRDTRRFVKAEKYTPTVWIDPDGCEHWVMDDGFEGFMTPHLTRDGKPVCHDRPAR